MDGANGPTEDIGKVIVETLEKPPATSKDALVLYEKLSTKIAMEIASSLPAVEAKMFLGFIWAVKEVEQVAMGCTCLK